MTRQPAPRFLAMLAVIAALAGCAAPASERDGDSRTDSAWATSGPASSTGVDELPVQQIADLAIPRLAGDLAPPTNRWFSGLAFGAEPQPVFPFPLAFAARDDGFTVDLPGVAASAKTIAAPFAGGLDIEIGSTSFEVVRYDPVSVTLEYSDDEGALGRLTIAEGSPVVSFTAARDTVLHPAETLMSAAEGVWETQADDTLYGVRAPEASYMDGGLRVPGGSSAQWFAVPDDSSVEDWADALDTTVSAVQATYSVGEDSARTRLVYADEGDTILVPFPGHEIDTDCELGTFVTAYGTAQACAAGVLQWSVPRLEARSAYDLDGLGTAEREALVSQLTADIEAAEPVPADTYFGGKGLARIAGFLSLARDLGERALAERAADRLWTELEPWTDPSGCETRDARCFVYDDALRTVVGLTPSFGSEEANDHHFHYGYFLAAGAALADYRPETVDALAPVLDVLAADIATGAEGDALPVLRNFDPYRGHSWASGLSPFADGNNQESSSEAVAAWNGLALWARARGDEDLAERADWMLSAEASAARSLWLEPALDELPDGYEHGIVSLTWGGKRDYATWFSPEPSAILGIQILPVGPISLDYLAGSQDRVAANVAEAGGDAAYSGPLGDYVLMYSALGGADALAAARNASSGLTDEDLDDGNSRSAMLAWLAAVNLAQER
jgi:endo-1,3(4)-beta-glucanase